jgi:hypothetical protein
VARTFVIAAAAVATASLFAPAALAERPDDRAGPLGVGGAGALAAAVTRPDDRAARRGPEGAEATRTTSVRPDDRSGTRFPGAVPIVSATETASLFDWSDAAIGAVGALGAALLILAATRLVGREGRRQAAV